MPYTCYANIINSNPNSAGPPAQMEVDVVYSIVDTVANSMVNTVQSGTLNGYLATIQNTPIVSAQTGAAAQIQAVETATPLMTFVWF